ncbi:hypothetical protein [Marinobacterium jannaschii]|uniref:hypothetical protein n=1 Tax=Marinobacterium jannaschii TaxID=64970 RepID=UPI000684B07F|nr:hypothetical protein [Marinobacterium jannaschii]
MKISSSEVAFNSQHQKESRHEYRELRAEQRQPWALSANERLVARGSQVDISYDGRVRSEKSDAVRSSSVVTDGDRVRRLQQNHNVSEIVSGVLKRDVSVRDLQIPEPVAAQVRPRAPSVQALTYESIQSLDALIISTLTGEEPVGTPLNIAAAESSELQVGAEMPAILQAEQTQVNIQQYHHFKEEERLQVASQGRITTADGREINFMLELEMNRSFELEETLEQERLSRAMIDPLVINLSGGTAGLTSSSFSFDLDADGSNEDISFVTEGSGFLALDINEDGQINDGSELFGTQGTEGFAHLARYDSDGNRWIDENDEVFSKLKVWTRDENGQDKLLSLKEAGVGAIHLGSTSSSFDLTDSNNNLLGQVKRSGVFLMESGTVASIQELDLAVHGDSSSAGEQGRQAGTFVLGAEFDAAVNNTNSARGGLDASADRPGFIELMLPPLKSPGGQERKQSLEELLEEQSETRSQISSNDTGAIDEEEPEGDSVRVLHIDQSVLDVMGRLREKTVVQKEEEGEQLSQMKVIIENLEQQREQHQDEVKVDSTGQTAESEQL